MASLKIFGNINVMGVYVLETIDTEEILYVGSSIQCNDAKDRHLHNLKTGKYKKNKLPLWEAYENDNLQIRVIFRCFDEKEMEVIEEQIINASNGITNVQKKVSRHSSNKDSMSTYKRRMSNIGENNPNQKYDKKILAEILWLKLNGYAVKKIEEVYKDTGIKADYIYHIGVTKWINLEPMKPNLERWKLI